MDAYTALAMGVAWGTFAALVSAVLRYERWDRASIPRRLAMIGAGSLAAFISGSLYLDSFHAAPVYPAVFRLWAIMTAFGWSTQLGMDILSKKLTIGFSSRKEEDEEK